MGRRSGGRRARQGSGRAAHSGARREAAAAAGGRLVPARSGPQGDRHRQSFRAGHDPDSGCGQRAGPGDRLRQPPQDPRRDPDRCCHQSRQLGRAAAQFPGAAGGRQHGHLQPDGRKFGHRLCHSCQHSLQDRPGADYLWPRADADAGHLPAAAAVRRVLPPECPHPGRDRDGRDRGRQPGECRHAWPAGNCPGYSAGGCNHEN